MNKDYDSVVNEPYDIIVKFPNKELAHEFMGQMSDGFGEGFCSFKPLFTKKEGTDGTKQEDWDRVLEDGAPVCYVSRIFEF